jgi:hypothetical protein
LHYHTAPHHTTSGLQTQHTHIHTHTRIHIRTLLHQQKQALAEAAAKAPVVNSAEFLSLKPQELGPDQLFFHRFFREKAERDRRLGRDKGDARQGDGDGDGDSDSYSDGDSASDEEEDEGEDEEEDDEEASDAEEAEIDAYADQLAQSLMRNHGAWGLDGLLR